MDKMVAAAVEAAKEWMLLPLRACTKQNTHTHTNSIMIISYKTKWRPKRPLATTITTTTLWQTTSEKWKERLYSRLKKLHAKHSRLTDKRSFQCKDTRKISVLCFQNLFLSVGLLQKKKQKNKPTTTTTFTKKLLCWPYTYIRRAK